MIIHGAPLRDNKNKQDTEPYWHCTTVAKEEGEKQLK